MATRKYNWEGLFDRLRTILVRGVDYHCSQSTMAQTIRNNASQRGVRVRLTDTGTTIEVEVVGAFSHPDKVGVDSQQVALALAQDNGH